MGLPVQFFACRYWPSVVWPLWERTAPQSTQRFIIFLFDDMHLSYEDLAHSQKAVAAILDSALTPSDMVAAVSVSGQTNSGFNPTGKSPTGCDAIVAAMGGKVMVQSE